MLKKALAVLTVGCVALAMAGSATAAAVGIATLISNPPDTLFEGPEAALDAPWQSWQISLETDAGELIGGVDVKINGELHQRWVDDDFGGTPDDPTPNAPTPDNPRGDSQLTAVAGALFGRGPSEDNSMSGSPLPSTAQLGYGVGTFLDGAWGIQDATETADLALIVVPADSRPNLDIQVRVANPSGDIFSELTCSDFGDLCGGGGGDDPPIIGDLGPLTTSVLGETVSGMVDVDDGGAVDALDFDDIANPDYTPGFGAINPDIVFSNQPTLGLDGSFEWNTTGAKPGTYEWGITGTNGDGSDGGLVTVEVTVPEPATFALCGLALVGLVGLRRRS